MLRSTLPLHKVIVTVTYAKVPPLNQVEPVILTFRIVGETGQVARMLAEHSAEPEDLAAGLYRRIEEIARNG